jgi:hypothetical protein
MYINPLKPNGHYMYRQFNIQQFYVLPAVFLYVLCEFENNHGLFPYTALNDCFCNRNIECLLRGTDWIFEFISGKSSPNIDVKPDKVIRRFFSIFYRLRQLLKRCSVECQIKGR